MAQRYQFFDWLPNLLLMEESSYLGWSTSTFLPGNVAGIALLKTYQYAPRITLQLRNLTTA